MTRYAANLSMLFTPLPFLERFDAAARAGFDAVEFWWPSQPLREGLRTRDIVRRARDLGLEVVLLNFDGGDMPAGDRGLAGDSERVRQFRENVPVAIDLALELGCRKLNALAGNAVPGHKLSAQMDVLADSVAFAADAASAHGMAIMLEALNPTDTPRYLLPRAGTVLALIERLGLANVAFQFDTYHVAKAGDDLRAVIATAGQRIGHVQFADFPGRHEPGSGQIPFGAILSDLASFGYQGAVGLEYAPRERWAPDFSFLARLGSWHA